MKVSNLLKKQQSEDMSGIGAPQIGTMYSEIILDASGSMHGGKYNAACEGIKEEIIQLNKDKSNVRTIVRITEFEGDWREGTNKCMKFSGPCELATINFKPRGTGGSTPLYATLGYILDDLQTKMVKGDTAIVKIFTDGGENSSYGSPYANASTLAQRIKQAEDAGVIITFVGTQFDVDVMIKSMGISKGNTIAHNNTPESLTKAFKVAASATRGLRQDYGIGGQSVASAYKTDFFSQNKEEEQQ